ncbi:serine-type endopeptidase [Aureococcus anophagefferens]|nr:serine-type endopeptidase [Aureococcus anophagefferens]
MLRVLAVAALASAMVPRTMERVVQTAKKEAAAGTLDGTVKMKLKRSAAQAPRSRRVAEAMGCAPPRRVFRPAGKHELKHSLARTDRALLDAVETLAAGLAIQRTGYDMDDPLRSAQTHYDAINLDEAWEMGAGDPSIVVAVVDTGMDMDHPDLQKNVWVNDGEICGNGVDDDKNGYVDDCCYNFADDKGNGDLFGDGSHGTHCAGTIAADNDNDLYVSGVAGGKNGNAGASLMTLVAFGQVSYGGFAEGIVYAADNGAKIVSNSWGYTAPDQYAEDELAAIDYADDLGVAVVFAAGNAGTDENWYPAYYDRAIAVAAVDDDGVAAYFTCFGDWIDVSAPGVGVLSTVAMSEGATDYYDGTSMACPHVAGLLALGWAIDPSRSKDDVLDCLYGTATDLDERQRRLRGQARRGPDRGRRLRGLHEERRAVGGADAVAAADQVPDDGVADRDLLADGLRLRPLRPRAHARARHGPVPRGDGLEPELGQPRRLPRRRDGAKVRGRVRRSTKYTETVEGLCADFEYTFTIADTYGDGILEGGSYVVTVGGADVAAGATFQYSESTTAEAVVVSWESDVWQESAYSFKVGVAREGGDMSWSYPACQASGQGAFFHVLTAADGLECGESYEILVMQGDAQTETIVARTLACDGSDDDAACVCDCGSDYEEDDCADSTSWYYKKSKDTCSDYVTKKSKNCKKKDEFKVKAEDASAAASLRARAFPSRDARPRRCPLTCGVCSSSDCEDSTSWYYKKSKDTCADYVTKKSKNCRRGRVETRRSRARRRDRFAGKKYGVDDVLAEDACPVTCGAC